MCLLSVVLALSGAFRLTACLSSRYHGLLCLQRLVLDSCLCVLLGTPLHSPWPPHERQNSCLVPPRSDPCLGLHVLSRMLRGFFKALLCCCLLFRFYCLPFLVSAARCPGPAVLQRRERLCAHCRCGWFWLATIGAVIRNALQLLFGTLLSACSPRPVHASGLPLLALSDRSDGDVSTDVDVDYFLDVLPSELLPLVCLVCKSHCCGFSHACVTSPLLSASCSS